MRTRYNINSIASIAVIGPNSDDVLALLANYRGMPWQVVTPLEGIRKKISPTSKLYTARACELADGVGPLTAIPSNYLRPADADGYQTGLTAVYFPNLEFKGEPAINRVDHLVDFVWKDTTPLTVRMGDNFSVYRKLVLLVVYKLQSHLLGCEKMATALFGTSHSWRTISSSRFICCSCSCSATTRPWPRKAWLPLAVTFLFYWCRQLSPMYSSCSVWAERLPLISSNRTTSILNSALYVFLCFVIMILREWYDTTDLKPAYLQVHLFGGTSFVL